MAVTGVDWVTCWQSRDETTRVAFGRGIKLDVFLKGDPEDRLLGLEMLCLDDK